MLEKRVSQSRPGAGIVTIETRGYNQERMLVCEFRRSFLLPDQGAGMTIVGAHHTASRSPTSSARSPSTATCSGSSSSGSASTPRTYVREIVGQPDATLHQAMLRFPGSDHMLELIDYRGVDRTPVDTNPVNPGTAHICVLVRDLRALLRLSWSRTASAR